MNKTTMSLINIAVLGYCFLLIINIIAIAILNPGKTILTLLAMAGIGTLMPGNPTYAAWLALQAQYKKLRAKAPAQAPGAAV